MNIKKIILKDNKNNVQNYTFTKSQLLTIDTEGSHYEGIGKGRNDCLILTGDNQVSIENCVVLLRDFNGNINAKNSQIYVESSSSNINCANCSIDIIGAFSGQINAVKSMVTVMGGTADGNFNLQVFSAYIGPKFETLNIFCDSASVTQYLDI